jgi:acyl carrier protein
MTAHSNSVRQAVWETVATTLQNSGRPAPVMTDDLLLADELRIDSLDLAVIVVELERKTGRDPFRQFSGSVRTVGDLVAMYEQPSHDNDN